MPAEIWDFNKFYSDKPDDTDRFVCKVLAAGALAVYLEIVTKGDPGAGDRRTEDGDATARAVEIINALINMCSGDRSPDPADFDPFQHDPALAGKKIDATLRKEYSDRVTRLFADFQSKFGVRDCVDILGFDPFSYEDYDEETQEKIESGEWMAKCVECMQHIITTIGDS